MGDANTALAVDKDNATVSVEPRFQVVKRALGGILGHKALFHAVGGPLAQHEFHHRLAPSRGGDRGTQVVGIAAATDERRVANASRGFIEGATRRSGGSDIAVTVQRDRTNRVDRAHGTKLVGHLKVALLFGFAQTVNLADEDQVVVVAEFNAVLVREALGALADKIDVRTLGENFLSGTDGIADVLDASDAAGTQSRAVHHAGVKLDAAVHVEERSAAGVEGLVIFHGNDSGFHPIETASAALQDREASCGRSLHAV